MGLDRFIFMLPRRYLRSRLWQDVLGDGSRAGAMGLTLVAGMHEAIAAAARAGNNILADHVLVERQWVLDCARLFATLPAYLIGIQCPLEVVDERERQRKDRPLSQARAQLPPVHRYANYDLKVDTSAIDPAN